MKGKGARMGTNRNGGHEKKRNVKKGKKGKGAKTH